LNLPQGSNAPKYEKKWNEISDIMADLRFLDAKKKCVFDGTALYPGEQNKPVFTKV
jgi:hypothetical protein